MSITLTNPVRVCPTQCPTGSLTPVSHVPYRGTGHGGVAWVEGNGGVRDTVTVGAAKLKGFASRNPRPRPRSGDPAAAQGPALHAPSLAADSLASTALNSKGAERRDARIGVATRGQLAISTADRGENREGRSIADDRLAFSTARPDVLSRTYAPHALTSEAQP